MRAYANTHFSFVRWFYRLLLCIHTCVLVGIHFREARAALIALEQLRTPVGTFVLRWENRTLLLSYKTRAGIGHTALDIEQDGTDSLQVRMNRDV
jgi:hypothetical protein